MKSTLIHQRVEAARQGNNQTVICQMASGWAVLGDSQFIAGYCLLLPDPVVLDLNTLQGKQRQQFLNDMTILGDALLEVTQAYLINYEILGNTERALHAHIFPRYMSELENCRKFPVFVSYSREQRNSRPFDYQRDKTLMKRIETAIRNRS
ncbi:MAG: hypothetical protein AAGG00_10840 [Cyanobacteria bacterium P01_H01_bin.150]